MMVSKLNSPILKNSLVVLSELFKIFVAELLVSLISSKVLVFVLQLGLSFGCVLLMRISHFDSDEGLSFFKIRVIVELNLGLFLA